MEKLFSGSGFAATPDAGRCFGFVRVAIAGSAIAARRAAASAAPAAARGQPASSAERRRTAGSSRPSKRYRRASRARDGSGFPFGHFFFTIRRVEKRSRRRRPFRCGLLCPRGRRAARFLAALHGLRPHRPPDRSFSAHFTTKVRENDRSGNAGTDPPLLLCRALEGGHDRQALGVHPDTVRRAIEVERFHRAEQLRASMLDPYLPLCARRWSASAPLRHAAAPDAPGSRLRGSVQQLRRVVARLRPQPQEAFLRLQVFAGEQAQVDWALFGTVWWAAPGALVLLRDDLVLVAGAVSGVLLRSDDGELLARPRARLRAVPWRARVLLYDNLKSPCWNGVAA